MLDSATGERPGSLGVLHPGPALWPLRLGVSVSAFEIASSWPRNNGAPGAVLVGGSSLPATVPATIGLANGGLGGSTPLVVGALNLVSSWRALWLLAMVRPVGICLPSLAPPG